MLDLLPRNLHLKVIHMSTSHEVNRQAAVHRYDILDTPPDGTFDSITAIAATIFDVPIAIVSIVDHDRIWFKSHHGLEIDQVDRTPGCALQLFSATTRQSSSTQKLILAH